jgi:hypothetical protein
VPRFEIGYWCRTRSVGHGYVTEAVRGITSFALEHLGARRVEIRCGSLNERSVGVTERAGSRLEGEIRNAEIGADGSPRNVLVFSVLPADRAAALPWPWRALPLAIFILGTPLKTFWGVWFPAGTGVLVLIYSQSLLVGLGWVLLGYALWSEAGGYTRRRPAP